MRKKFKKGVSLYFTVIIMSVILSLSLALSAILFSQIRVIREIGYSTKAFYAADSGIERIFSIFDPNCSNYGNQTDCENSSGCQWINENCIYICSENNPCLILGTQYYFKILDPINNPNECSGNNINYCVRSYGIYKDIKRAIQITF